MQKLSHKKVLLFLIITPLLLVLELAIAFGVFANIQATNREEAKTARLDLYLRTNTKYISYAESAQRGYLLTGDSIFRDSIDVDATELRKNQIFYDSLPAELKSDRIAEIQKISARKMSRLALTIKLYDSKHQDSALNMIRTGIGAKMTDSIRKASTGIRTELADRIAQEKQNGNILFSLFLGLIAVLIIFSVFVVWYTYRKFNDYTQSLEQMVGSLQDANERMSQYTTQSYHELKTPLRNINGFAQLLKRKHAGAEEGTEESEYVGYITEGIKQMDKIINDMRGKYLDIDKNEID